MSEGLAVLSHLAHPLRTKVLIAKQPNGTFAPFWGAVNATREIDQIGFELCLTNVIKQSRFPRSPWLNETALRLRNSLLTLAVLFDITNLSKISPQHSHRSHVVRNAVTPEFTPPKSRGRGDNNEDGVEVGFCVDGITCRCVFQDVLRSVC